MSFSSSGRGLNNDQGRNRGGCGGDSSPLTSQLQRESSVGLISTSSSSSSSSLITVAASCIMEGFFEKQPRNRDMFSKFISIFRDSTWFRRRFRLMDNKELLYYDENELKGSFRFEDILIDDIPPKDVGNKPNVILLSTNNSSTSANAKDSFRIMIALDEKIIDEFKMKMGQVSESWILHCHLNMLADSIGIHKSAKARRLTYEINQELFMQKLNLNAASFNQIFYDECPRILVSKIAAFIKRDKKFADVLFFALSSKRIILATENKMCIGNESSSSRGGGGSSGGVFVPRSGSSLNSCYITGDGSLLIEIKDVSKIALASLADELPEILSQGREPYVVSRSMRENKMNLDAALDRIAVLLNRRSSVFLRVEFDHFKSLMENQKGILLGFFGEIFYKSYPEAVYELLKSLSTPALAMFNSKFNGLIAFVPSLVLDKSGYEYPHRCSLVESFTVSEASSSVFQKGTFLIEIGEDGIMNNMSKFGHELKHSLMASLDSTPSVAVSTNTAAIDP